MKIIVLHGDDVERSYGRLTKFIEVARSRKWEVINDKVEETPSLFGTEKLIILRKYQILGKKELKLIEKIPGTLVIYHNKNIPATFLKKLKEKRITDLVVEKFELPKILWNFLDNINIQTFQKVVETEPVELVFAMIARSFRDLYWVKTGNPKMSPWQLSKLKSQSNKYTEKQLKEIITDLAKMDVDAKTGKGTLKDSIDFLILKKLS